MNRHVGGVTGIDPHFAVVDRRATRRGGRGQRVAAGADSEESAIAIVRNRVVAVAGFRHPRAILIQREAGSRNRHAVLVEHRDDQVASHWNIDRLFLNRDILFGRHWLLDGWLFLNRGLAVQRNIVGLDETALTHAVHGKELDAFRPHCLADNLDRLTLTESRQDISRAVGIGAAGETIAWEWRVAVVYNNTVVNWLLPGDGGA